MTDRSSFERRVSDWLEDGPTHAPDQILETVRSAIPSIPQRHRPAPYIPIRNASMRSSARLAAALAAVVVIAVAAVWVVPGLQRGTAGGPPVASPALGSPSPTASAAPSADPLASLERPLALPTYAGTCPRSTGHQVLSDVGLGLGSGPVWPVGFGTAGQSTLGQSSDGIWHAVKVLRAADPSYLGPVLVRGRRIDGAGVLRFSQGGVLSGPEELRLDAGGPAAIERTWPSYTLVQTTGCYAYQIDGTSFSATVVFEITN
jgi:hypothetical protein